jgi:hypothetical protein
MVKYAPPPFSTLKPGASVDATKAAASLKTFTSMLKANARALGVDVSTADWTEESCELATGLWGSWHTAASMRACMYICHKKDFDNSNCAKATMIKWAVKHKVLPIPGCPCVVTPSPSSPPPSYLTPPRYLSRSHKHHPYTKPHILRVIDPATKLT